MKKIILNKISRFSPNYKKYYALVDDEDFEILNQYNWQIRKDEHRFYATRNDNGRIIRMHISIMNGKHIDHINGNGLDNRKVNLRFATNQENQMNCRKQKNGVSNFKGVSYHKRDNRWTSQIKINGKQIHIGTFNSEIDAAQAYNFAADKYFGQFARLN